MLQVHDVHVREQLERYRREAELSALAPPSPWRRGLARLLREMARRLEPTTESQPTLRRT